MNSEERRLAMTRATEVAAAKQERMAAILEEHGIHLEVGGCGCDGSPWVKFVYKGELIVESDHYNFSNFPDEDAAVDSRLIDYTADDIDRVDKEQGEPV